MRWRCQYVSPGPASCARSLIHVTCTAIADSVVRCLPEDQSNGFFVACFVRAEPTSTGADDSATAAAVVDSETPELTHAERQEAFKAKARAKGGKGAPKAPVPKPVREVVQRESAAGKAPSGKVEQQQKKKAAVPGKKAAYLAEKKRKQEAKDKAGKA